MGECFFKGVSFGFYARNGYYATTEARREIDRIASLGIPLVCLIVTVMQDHYYSPRMYRDFINTPSDDELIGILDYAHKKGLKVMLRPMLECWDGMGRGRITVPDDDRIPGLHATYRKGWFTNYEALTKHYTRIATQTGCESYGLDSELNQLIHCTHYWLKVIETARKNFKGHLTTSFINTEQFTPFLEEDPGHWLYALDSVGTSMYHPGGRPGEVHTAETVAAFLGQHLESMRNFAQVYGKTFYFGECGCRSLGNAVAAPSSWGGNCGYDGNEQDIYLQGVIRCFSKEAWWKGLLWWKWDEQLDRTNYHDDPAGDKGFTLWGKPAADTLAAWCKEK